MVHTHLKTSEASRCGNHHNGQDKGGNNSISSWMIFQPDTKNFPGGDKECKLPQMDRPQQSIIFKAYASQHCNSPRTYGPGKKKPPIYKGCEIRNGSWGRQNFFPGQIIIEDSWAMRNHNPFQYEEKGFQWTHWRFPAQAKQGKFLCYDNVWLW